MGRGVVTTLKNLQPIILKTQLYHSNVMQLCHFFFRPVTIIFNPHMGWPASLDVDERSVGGEVANQIEVVTIKQGNDQITPPHIAGRMGQQPTGVQNVYLRPKE